MTYGGVGVDGSSPSQSRRLFLPYSARRTLGVCFFFAAARASAAGELAGGGGGWKEVGGMSVGFVRCCQRRREATAYFEIVEAALEAARLEFCRVFCHGDRSDLREMGRRRTRDRD